MNINSINLLNSRSFLEQKMNLTSDVKKQPHLWKRIIFNSKIYSGWLSDPNFAKKQLLLYWTSNCRSI